VLDGEFTYVVKGCGDHGKIYIRDNIVESVRDTVFNRGPSWQRNYNVDSDVKSAIEAVLADPPANTRLDAMRFVSREALNQLAEVIGLPAITSHEEPGGLK